MLKKPGILDELYQEIEYQIKKTKISQQKKEVQIGKDLMNLLKSNLILSNYIFQTLWYVHKFREYIINECIIYYKPMKSTLLGIPAGLQACHLT